jgi:hypothetical protein
MADYGLIAFNSKGNKILDITDTLTRLRYADIIASGTSSSVVLSDIAGLKSTEISIKTDIRFQYVAHSVSRSGTTFSYTAQSNALYGSSQSVIFMFLYT